MAKIKEEFGWFSGLFPLFSHILFTAWRKCLISFPFPHPSWEKKAGRMWKEQSGAFLARFQALEQYNHVRDVGSED